MLVHPLAPLGVVHREGGLGALLGSQAGEERLGRLAHGLGGDAGGADLEQAGFDRAGRGDPFERLGEARLLGVADISRKRWALPGPCERAAEMSRPNTAASRQRMAIGLRGIGPPVRNEATYTTTD